MNCFAKVIFLSGLAVGSSVWAASSDPADNREAQLSGIDWTNIRPAMAKLDAKLEESKRSYHEAGEKLKVDAQERNAQVAELQKRHEEFQAAANAATEKLRGSD